MSDTEVMPDAKITTEIPAAPAADPSSSFSAVTATTAPKKAKKIIKVKKKRPARPQVDPSIISSEPPPQTGTTFNIWYNKWAGGDREDKYLSQTEAKGRCNVALDTGYTRADKVAGSYFCLFFARGICPKGQDCEYLHRLPSIHDLFSSNIDCFGRDKFSDYRDDMGGVGSFLRQNRTIYVGRIHVTDDIEEIVSRHFAEWGEIERIRVLNTRGVAFITYSNEANAQFAKEAMAHQGLDHNEVLNVRWATADPNPMAQAREARRIEEQAAEAIRRALPAEFFAELEGKNNSDGTRKRRRIEENSQVSGGGDGNNEHAETMMLEAPATGHQNTMPWQEQDQVKESIFSGRTLEAINSARVAISAKATNGADLTPVTRGPLVGYGSDDDDE